MANDKVPSLSYDKVVAALKRDGWVVVRQRGSHIRLQKHTRVETLKITVPRIVRSSDRPSRIF